MKTAKRRAWVTTQRRRRSSTPCPSSDCVGSREESNRDTEATTGRSRELKEKNYAGTRGLAELLLCLQSDSKARFLSTNQPHKPVVRGGACIFEKRNTSVLGTIPFHQSFPLPPCQQQHFSPPPLSASLVVNSFSSGVGRGCLERLQAEKLSRKRIPPQHVIISLLEAKQLRQLFSLSHLDILYTHKLSAGRLTPALLHHHTNVTQPACQLSPANLRQRAQQFSSAPRKTSSH